MHLDPAAPEASVARLYSMLRRHRVVHALVDATPATTMLTGIVLALHAMLGAFVDVTVSTRDPTRPYTRINLQPLTVLRKGLKPSMREALKHLVAETRLNPARLSALQGISRTTAEKLLRSLRRLGLAEYRLGWYTPTPWARLVVETL